MFSLKKILVNCMFNSCLFLILIIGIQNNKNQKVVSLIVNETIELPTGFIIGISFITGSIVGSLIPLEFKR